MADFDPRIAYEYYLRSIDGLCAVDRDLRYHSWNAALAEISGVSAEEALGKTVFELFPFLENVGEREVHRRVFSGETVFMEPRPYDVPSKMRRGHFQGVYFPWRNEAGDIIGIFMAIRDVGSSFNRLLFLRDLSNALSMLDTPAEVVSQTLEIISKATPATRGRIALLDNQGLLTVESQLGFSEEEAAARGQRLSLEEHPSVSEALSCLQPVTSSDARFRVFCVPAVAEKEALGVLQLFYPREYRLGDDDRSFVMAATNLFAQSYARMRQFERAKAARAEAEAANLEKTRFLANVSHELRTPLSVITGFAELMGDPGSHSLDELKTFSDTIVRQSRLLTKILGDLLDLSMIETGRIRMESERIRSRPWLEEIYAMAGQLASAKPIRVELLTDDDLPSDFLADGDRAKQILMNLLSNAVKYTNQGEIWIHATSGQLDNGKPALRILVRDTGIGIPQGQISSLYTELRKQTKGPRTSTGLGLNIASRLAHAMGGSLKLMESEVGKGSSFEVRLPAAEPSATSTFPDTPRDSPGLRGLTILVADDSPEIVDLLRRLLVSQGAKVLTARDGLEATEAVVTQEVDAVILDLNMPNLDGYEACKRIRKGAFFKPVIACSAHIVPGDHEEILRSGFDDFVAKPTTVDTLVEKILSVRAQKT